MASSTSSFRSFASASGRRPFTRLTAGDGSACLPSRIATSTILDYRFLPPKDKANGTAVVIAPGGGFRELVFNAEGVQAAQFLNSIGVTAFALKYRLPGEPNSPYTKENVRQDAYRAMRLVRSRARNGTSTRIAWECLASRPGRSGLDDRLCAGRRRSISAGPRRSAQWQAGLSDDGVSRRRRARPVPPNSPPAFLLVANDDQYGCDKVTLDFYEKLHAAGVPVEAIFLPQGKHAFNMGDRSKLVTVNTWPQRMADWMKDMGYLTPAAASTASTSP